MSVVSKIQGKRMLGPLGLSSREKNLWDNNKDKESTITMEQVFEVYITYLYYIKNSCYKRDELYSAQHNLCRTLNHPSERI